MLLSSFFTVFLINRVRIRRALFSEASVYLAWRNRDVEFFPQMRLQFLNDLVANRNWIKLNFRPRLWGKNWFASALGEM